MNPMTYGLFRPNDATARTLIPRDYRPNGAYCAWVAALDPKFNPVVNRIDYDLLTDAFIRGYPRPTAVDVVILDDIDIIPSMRREIDHGDLAIPGAILYPVRTAAAGVASVELVVETHAGGCEVVFWNARKADAGAYNDDEVAALLAIAAMILEGRRYPRPEVRHIPRMSFQKAGRCQSCHGWLPGTTYPHLDCPTCLSVLPEMTAVLREQGWA